MNAGRQRFLVTGALGLHRRVDGQDAGRRRCERRDLRQGRRYQAPAAGDGRGRSLARDHAQRRHHRPRGYRAGARRPRHRPRHPPRGPAAALRQGQPTARCAGQRGRHGQPLRGGQGTARAHRAHRLRRFRGHVQLGRRHRRPTARGCGAASAEPLRRLQAGQRGQRAASTRRTTASPAWACGRWSSTVRAATRASPAIPPRPSSARSWAGSSRSASTAASSSSTRRMWRAPSSPPPLERSTVLASTTSTARWPRSTTFIVALDGALPGAASLVRRTRQPPPTSPRTSSRPPSPSSVSHPGHAAASDAIAATLALYRERLDEGRLDPAEHGLV